jgi:type II secretory pathway pseudopilin PulG
MTVIPLDRHPPITAQRGGLSLLETVLAVAILAASLAALGQQTFVGLRAGVRTDVESRAALLCQSQIESLLLEHTPSLPVHNQPIPHESDWMWSAELRPVSDVDGMQWLVVSVHKPGASEALSQYSLSRLIPVSPPRGLKFSADTDDRRSKF